MISRYISFDVGVRNFAVAVLDIVHGEIAQKMRVRHWECFDLLEGTRKKNANAVSSRSLRELLWTSLDRRSNVFFDNDVLASNMHVGVEMQMKSKMSILETTIWGYFKDRVHTVESIHARKKFNIACMQDVVSAGGSYAQNKKQAITTCGRFLTTHGYITECEQLAQSKKKDDLADAFLQALFLSEKYASKYFSESQNDNNNSGPDSAGDEEGAVQTSTDHGEETDTGATDST